MKIQTLDSLFRCIYLVVTIILICKIVLTIINYQTVLQSTPIEYMIIAHLFVGILVYAFLIISHFTFKRLLNK